MIPLTPKSVHPDLPPFPKINFPKWIIPEIKYEIENHLKFIKRQKKMPLEVRNLFDLYDYLVVTFNKVKKVFTDSRMELFWKKLYSLSKENTIEFVRLLFFRIENDFDYGLTLIHKHKEEILSGERMILAAKKLFLEMENYQYWFYGHVIHENHGSLMNNLSQFIQDTECSIINFKEYTKKNDYIFSDVYPLTRQSEEINARAIFYMRKIYLFFKMSFDKPMYANIAEIINLIFSTEYTENHVVKYCKKVRPLLNAT